MGYPSDPPDGPDIEAPADLLCPKCKDPQNGAWAYEIDGFQEEMEVVKWECNCGHIFDDPLA